MKSLYEYMVESSSLFHDMIEPSTFDMEKSLKTSEFTIRIHQYKKHQIDKFAHNLEYWQSTDLKEFREIRDKIKNGKEFKQEILDENFTRIFWEDLNTVKNVMWVWISVSGSFNSGEDLLIDCETGEAYEVDRFRNNFEIVKEPDKKRISRYIMKRPKKWDGTLHGRTI